MMEAKISAEARADAGRDVKAIAVRNWLALTAVMGWAGGRTRRAARHGTGWAAVVAKIRGINQLHAQNNGIDDFDNSIGQVAIAEGALIHVVQTTLGAKDLSTAFAAKEENALVKDGKAGDLDGACGTDKGIGGDAIEITDVYAVKAAVKTGRLHINLNMEQFCIARANTGGSVNHAL